MKVSVCMIVYNHEKYIKEAILGVLNQEVDFKVELLISNDKSTDNTHQVIDDLILNHDSDNISIKYKNRKTNKGMMLNFIKSVKSCKGEYLAFCEGDDYWTDPLKLKKQVQFLDQNLDYSICFHNVKIFDQYKNALEPDTITKAVPESTDISDLVQGNFMHTPSVLMRNDFKIPKWFKKSPLGDWILYMVSINDQKIIKLNDVMSVYRVHGSSVWSNKSNDFKLKQTIKSKQLLLKSKLFSEAINEQLEASIIHMEGDIIEKDIAITFCKRLKNKLRGIK